MMDVIDSKGMSTYDILNSSRIAMRLGSSAVELIRWSRNDWRIAGIGVLGVAMKPYTYEEVRELVEQADEIVVMKEMNATCAFRVR